MHAKRSRKSLGILDVTTLDFPIIPLFWNLGNQNRSCFVAHSAPAMFQ